MDNLLRRTLDAPDYLSYIHLVDNAAAQGQATFILIRQLCYTLEEFLCYQKEQNKGLHINAEVKKAFRDAWLDYKLQIHQQKHLYLSPEFQRLRNKAFAELGLKEYHWDALESCVPPYNPADGRNAQNLRNLLAP
jgi:hypothetical protein